jgi:hypothetical protein
MDLKTSSSLRKAIQTSSEASPYLPIQNHSKFGDVAIVVLPFLKSFIVGVLNGCCAKSVINAKISIK